MVLQVYLDPCTVNSRKVLAGLDLLNTEFNFNFINYFTGEHKSESYKKINPHATVPSATDDDLTITESNAILMYAADRDSKHDAYPTDLKKRAEVNRWLLWESSAWFPSCYVYLVEYVVKPLLEQEPDETIIKAEAPRWNKLAKILDSQLAKSKYLAGEQPTIADIAVASPMHVWKAQRLPLEDYPNLKRWMTDNIENLACWMKTQQAVEKALGLHKNDGSAKEVAFAHAPDLAKLETKKPGNNHAIVKSIMNYTKDLDPKLTELYFYETDAAKDAHLPGDDPKEVFIHDGWYRVKDFTIDKEGFALHDFTTKFKDWEEEDTVKSKFYPEIVDFLKASIGAKRVLVFDHTIRTKRNDAKKLTQESNTSQRAPVMLVHCDYTAESGPARVQQLLGDEAQDLLSRRVAFINVWKPIHNIVEERPLAMCEVPSAPAEDFFKLHLRYRDRNGENYVMQSSPNHKWWYFPKMNTEQVILLKTFDSETDGRARFVGHSAFEDPTSPENPPMRESVEIRTIAFF